MPALVPDQLFQSAPLPFVAVVGLTLFTGADPVALDHWTHVLEGSVFFIVDDVATLAQVESLLSWAEELATTVTITVDGVAQAVQKTFFVV